MRPVVADEADERLLWQMRDCAAAFAQQQQHPKKGGSQALKDIGNYTMHM